MSVAAPRPSGADQAELDRLKAELEKAKGRASDLEKDLGAISVGRYADFTVLSADPYAVAPESLRTLRVLRTIVGGAIAHSAR